MNFAVRHKSQRCGQPVYFSVRRDFCIRFLPWHIQASFNTSISVHLKFAHERTIRFAASLALFCGRWFLLFQEMFEEDTRRKQSCALARVGFR